MRESKVTCKDCIHYDVCQYHIDEETKCTLVEIGCADFKDKSKFVELPCKVGDTVYDTEYGSIYGKGERIMPCVVRRIITSQLIVVKPEGYEDKRYAIQDYSFGSSTFLTREEAEKAMKEREADEQL